MPCAASQIQPCALRPNISTCQLWKSVGQLLVQHDMAALLELEAPEELVAHHSIDLARNVEFVTRQFKSPKLHATCEPMLDPLMSLENPKIKCTAHPSCSGKPVRVVTTDLCPGGPCTSDSAHFDLSGTAFGWCHGKSWPRRQTSWKTIAFHVDQGSNPNYFAVVVEFEGGDGDLAHVDLKEASNKTVDGWRMMQQSWGPVWKLDVGSTLKPPISIRLTTQYPRQTLVASRVIPDNWQSKDPLE
ncbi:unnamed protein product [Camellia sinensis]